jgi:hypothetical protein
VPVAEEKAGNHQDPDSEQNAHWDHYAPVPVRPGSWKSKSAGFAHSHKDPVSEQVDSFSESGPPLSLRGAGHQHREYLLIVLATERCGIARK